MQAQAMSSPDDLKRRWQVVLTYHGGSAKLWREYLHWHRAQYGTFTVRQVSQTHQSAVQVTIDPATNQLHLSIRQSKQMCTWSRQYNI